MRGPGAYICKTAAVLQQRFSDSENKRRLCRLTGIEPEQIDLGLDGVELSTLQLHKCCQTIPLLGLLAECRSPRPNRSASSACIQLLNLDEFMLA